MEEVWKDIPNYEGLYQISSQGRVKSLARTVTFNKFGSSRRLPLRILCHTINRHGYPYCTLCKNGRTRHFLVHRLIMILFGPPQPEGKMLTNHKNGIKTDFRLCNLEWCNGSENVQHAYDTGLAKACNGQRQGLSKLLDTDVIEILKILESPYGVVVGTIYHIIYGNSWGHLKLAFKNSHNASSRENSNQ